MNLESTKTYGVLTQAPGHAGVHTVIRVVPAGRRVRVREDRALVDAIPHSAEGYNWRVGMRLWLDDQLVPMRVGPGTFTVR